MLKYSGIDDHEKVIVQMDSHIPLNVKLVSSEAIYSSLLYWRIGEGHSIFELGLSSIDGKFHSFSLVNMDTCDIEDIPVSMQGVNKQFGVPKFCMENRVEKSYMQEKKRFCVTLSEGELYVFFDTNTPLDSLIINDRILFGINQNNHMSFVGVK